LNLGLYDGGAPKWLRKEIRQREPYVIRKNIEIIPATRFTLPKATKMPAIKKVSMVALYGSRFSPLTLDIRMLNLRKGRLLSAATA
jgi:hypothetical protein